MTHRLLFATLTPYSFLPSPFSLLPSPYSLLPSPYSLLPTPYSPLSSLLSPLISPLLHNSQVLLYAIQRHLALVGFLFNDIAGSTTNLGSKIHYIFAADNTFTQDAAFIFFFATTR